MTNVGSSALSGPDLPAPCDLRSLRPLFDDLPEVYFFAKNREHRYIAANRALWLLHGCRSESDMLGRTDHDFHPRQLADLYVHEDEVVLRQGQPLRNQMWLVPGADGLPRWYRSTKTSIVAADGITAAGIAGVMRPHDQSGDLTLEENRLLAACHYVLEGYSGSVSVEEMARCVKLSVSQLQREFKRLFRTTPRDYIAFVRLQAARHRLERTSDSVGRIALACGFYDQSFLTKRFRAALGMTPLEYRRRFGR